MLTLAAFPILLGVLITVHELGHFLVAKACGVRVLTFSIGFGPKLFGFVRGDTEYRLSIIPLGGYVRMYGDDVTQEVPADQQRYAFLYKPFLQKSAIAAAGPIANMLLAFAIFFAMGVGTKNAAAAVIGTVMPGDVADAAGLRAGDRIVSIDGTPVKTFSDMIEIVGPRAGVPLEFVVERDGETKTLTIAPRSAPNPSPLDHEATQGRIGVMSGVFEPTVVGDARARAAGILNADRITKVNDTAVSTRDALFDALAAAGERVVLEVLTPATKNQQGENVPENRRTVTLERAASPGPGLARGPALMAVTSDELAGIAHTIAETRARTLEALHARERNFGLHTSAGLVTAVEPEGTAEAMGLKPGDDVIVALNGRTLYSNDVYTPLLAEPDKIHVMGVLTPDGAVVHVFRQLPSPRRELAGMKLLAATIVAHTDDGPTIPVTTSIGEALVDGVERTIDMTTMVLESFWALLTGKFGLAGIGGPITIAKASGEAAAAGLGAFLFWMAFFSVNLAVLNMLPVPVLDGGHLLLFTIEAIQRKRLTVETRMKAMKVGFFLIAILIVIALSNDILGLF